MQRTQNYTSYIYYSIIDEYATNTYLQNVEENVPSELLDFIHTYTTQVLKEALYFKDISKHEAVEETDLRYSLDTD